MWRNGFDGSYGVICGSSGGDRATESSDDSESNGNWLGTQPNRRMARGD